MQNSLLSISVDERVVGEHEPSVGTQQQCIAHIRHWRGFSGPPLKSTQMREKLAFGSSTYRKSIFVTLNSLNLGRF